MADSNNHTITISEAFGHLENLSKLIFIGLMKDGMSPMIASLKIIQHVLIGIRYFKEEHK